MENKEEASISDLWNLDGSRQLSDSWRGKTVFEFIRPPPKKNHYWVDGLEVRKQKTSRPGHIWPKVWDSLSEKARHEARKEWETLGPRIEEARKSRDTSHELDPKDKEFPKLLEELKEKLKLSLIHI